MFRTESYMKSNSCDKYYEISMLKLVKSKKVTILFLLMFVIIIIGIFYWNLSNHFTCWKEWEAIRIDWMDFPTKCCSDLKAMYWYEQEDCKLPWIPWDIWICTQCWNNICEKQNNENKCNCPEDCK